MTASESKYRGTPEYFVVMAELIRAARHRGAVTYQQLAVQINLPLRGNHMGREIGHVLGEISQDEVEQWNRPMLSAVAVHSTGNPPGPGDGFFVWARELGRLHSDDRKREMEFWEEEKDRVYRAWEQRFDKVP